VLSESVTTLAEDLFFLSKKEISPNIESVSEFVIFPKKNTFPFSNSFSILQHPSFI